MDVVDFTHYPIMSFDMLKFTFLKHLEDLFHTFDFKAEASTFLPPTLAAHSFWKVCFLDFIPLIES